MRYKTHIIMRHKKTGEEVFLANPEFEFRMAVKYLLEGVLYGVKTFNEKHYTNYTVEEFFEKYNIPKCEQLQKEYEKAKELGLMKLFEVEE